jgi:hypothetical protein
MTVIDWSKAAQPVRTGTLGIGVGFRLRVDSGDVVAGTLTTDPDVGVGASDVVDSGAVLVATVAVSTMGAETGPIDQPFDRSSTDEHDDAIADATHRSGPTTRRRRVMDRNA